MRTNLINKSSKVKKETPLSDALDMVIAFDTTGSMFSYINNVKKYCTELVPKLLKANPQMRISVVAFGDYCDMVDAKHFGLAYQVLPLTNDKNKIIEFIKGARDTSGGDASEFYELVIKKITEETEWRDDAAKAVLLIADDNPHPVGYTYKSIVINNQIDWIEEAKKAAEKGIKFDTLRIKEYGWYKKLSDITGGVSAPFKSSDKTSQLIKASVYSKSAVTMDMFMEECERVKESDDTEMKAVYAAYSKEIVK